MDFEEVMNNKWYRIFYKYILPILTILCFGFFPSLIHRKLIMGNIIPDILGRFVICVWFSALYIQISDIKNYRIYPNIRWTKGDVKHFEKIIIISGYTIFGVAIGFLTWWATQLLLPSHILINYFFAIVNGMIIAVPMITKYLVFKL
jgi:hypothetical protein